MSIEEYFEDWMNVINKDILLNTLKILEKVYKKSIVFPNTNDIFKAFKICPYNKTKIIFISQEPYFKKDMATGIAFGNTGSCISHSLQRIKDACIDYTKYHNHIDFDCTLESWAKQGVLLLNTALTVEYNRPGSHLNIWRNFMVSFLSNMSLYNTGLIYVFIGAQAIKFTPLIGKNNSIYTIKNLIDENDGISNKLFVSLDKEIKQKYNEEIHWYSEY